MIFKTPISFQEKFLFSNRISDIGYPLLFFNISIQIDMEHSHEKVDKISQTKNFPHHFHCNCKLHNIYTSWIHSNHDFNGILQKIAPVIRLLKKKMYSFHINTFI